MPPKRKEQPAAERAAHKLTVLQREKAVCNPLQRPAPAAALTPQQAGLLLRCCSALKRLVEAQYGEAAAEQVVGGAVRHQAVYSAGILLAWTQQQPHQFATAPLLQTYRDMENNRIQPTLASLWLLSHGVLQQVMKAIQRKESSSGDTSSALAAATMEQLEHQVRS